MRAGRTQGAGWLTQLNMGFALDSNRPGGGRTCGGMGGGRMNGGYGLALTNKEEMIMRLRKSSLPLATIIVALVGASGGRRL